MVRYIVIQKMLTEVRLAAFHYDKKAHEPPTGPEPLTKSGASTSPPKDGP